MRIKFNEDTSTWTEKYYNSALEGLKNTPPYIIDIYNSEEKWDQSKSGYLYRPGRKLILPISLWKTWKEKAMVFYKIGEQRLFRDPMTQVLHLQIWNGKKFIEKESEYDNKD